MCSPYFPSQLPLDTNADKRSSNNTPRTRAEPSTAAGGYDLYYEHWWE